MHLNRTELTRKIPVPRKGTKYVARALSHVDESVPVVVAVRDILGFAKNAREVKIMIQDKMIKINGRPVKDYRESVKLFNILEAGKKYVLTVKPTGRFSFEETKDDSRVAKVINKKILKNNKIQINLHDGSNAIYSKKIKVGDSVRLDKDNKITEVMPLEKGKKVFVFSGKNLGRSGKVKEIDNRKVKVEMEDKEAELDESHLISM